MIQEMEEKFGRPEVLRLTQEITPEEMALVRSSQKHGRAHDITLFIFRGEKLVLIRKPIHPPGVFRAPSGGLNPGEPFEEGAKREAREETGLEIEIERYLLRIQVRFICGEEDIEWSSHVFSAKAVGGELAPEDTREILAARWATLEELQGPIREAVLAPGWGLLDYRVTLTDRAVALLQKEQSCAP
ncbi:MAG TPA: NUDIX hydrolase [Chloroflexi bacterium]|nr:NUDIX hydrolase [Chloroflexota bacterium]